MTGAYRTIKHLVFFFLGVCMVRLLVPCLENVKIYFVVNGYVTHPFFYGQVCKLLREIIKRLHELGYVVEVRREQKRDTDPTRYVYYHWVDIVAKRFGESFLLAYLRLERKCRIDEYYNPPYKPTLYVEYWYYIEIPMRTIELAQKFPQLEDLCKRLDTIVYASSGFIYYAEYRPVIEHARKREIDIELVYKIYEPLYTQLTPQQYASILKLLVKELGTKPSVEWLERTPYIVFRDSNGRGVAHVEVYRGFNTQEPNTLQVKYVINMDKEIMYKLFMKLLDRYYNSS